MKPLLMPGCRLSLLTFLVLSAMSPLTQGQENAFLSFVKNRASELRAVDAPPATREAWEIRREQLRAQLKHAWGWENFAGTKCDLDPKVLGTLEREGYRVEKIIFQTMPDVWMTANAYIPTNGEGPFPAVLNVHGHGAQGKIGDAVQSRCINLVKQGFFVLAVDALGAGERGIGKALGEYHGDTVAAMLFPVGLSLCGMQVHENMRAVDYLESRPEVDPDRIGITGASGGGNQTMYAGAWDERFKAVVPVCSVGNYQAYLGAACCLCEVVPGALQFTELEGVLSMVAPRALMVISATKDAPQFAVVEAEKSIRGAHPVFQLHGVEDKHLEHVSIEAGHSYNQQMREAMYGWMQLHLQEKGDGKPVPELPHTVEDSETLRCFPGETRPDDWVTIPQIAEKQGRQLLASLEKSVGPDQTQAWKESVAERKQQLDQLLGGTSPRQPKLQERKTVDGTREAWTFQVEPGISLDLVRYQPEDKAASAQVLTLVVTTDETNDSRSHELAEAIQSAGGNVALLSLRATGAHKYASDRVRDSVDHNTAEWSLWLGRPLLGQWVTDVRSALSVLEEEKALSGNITVAGYGPASLVALVSGVLDERITKVAACEMLSSYVSDAPYTGHRLGTMVPRMLSEVGDVPHLIALLAPRPLVVAGLVDGQNRPVDLGGAVRKELDWLEEVYRSQDAGQNLTVFPSQTTSGLVGLLLGQ